MDPSQLRSKIRTKFWTGPTSGTCKGYLQANLVILPQLWMNEFLQYCHLNSQPLPVLGHGKVGDPRVDILAKDSDIRHDVAKYWVYRNGILEQTALDIQNLWEDDWVWALLGCSFSAEIVLENAGIHLWHLEHGKNVPMYRTKLETTPTPRWSGELVVSMRWINTEQVSLAKSITSQFPLAHGAPVAIGFSNSLGIDNIARPEWGDFYKPPIDDVVPIFWACGVTSQSAIIRSRPPIAITHAPGHMFVSDWPVDKICNLTTIE